MKNKLHYVAVDVDGNCTVTKQYITLTPSMAHVLMLLYGKKGLEIERHMTVHNLKYLSEVLISWANGTTPDLIIEMKEKLLPKLREWDDNGRLLLFQN